MELKLLSESIRRDQCNNLCSNYCFHCLKMAPESVNVKKLS